MEKILKQFWRAFIGIGLLLAVVIAPRYASADSTIVVTPDNANGWWFFQETPTGSGTFVYGPSTAPLGGGSAQLTVNNTGGVIFGTFAFVGTRLDAITSLAYRTFRVSGSSALAPSLQFDIDTNVTDTNTAWQGRLVYEPYYTHTVSTGVWQTWNPLDNSGTGNWWFSGAPGNAVCSISHACTWAQVRAAFPNAGIRSAGTNTGALQFKAGGGWTSGFVGSIDAFSIGVNNTVTTYDFELSFTVPTTTSISPSSKLTSDSTFTLTVNGTNFFSSSIVQVNGSNRVTTFVSPTQLNAIIPASDLTLANTFPITVINPTPGGGTSNAQVLSVIDNNPPPLTTPLATPLASASATLHVVKLVVNGNNGTAIASDFSVHVTNSGIDVAGSPTAGVTTLGTSYALNPGTYTVSEDPNTLYAQTFTGACDAQGSVSLSGGDDKICTIISTGIPPPPSVVPLISSSSGGGGGSIEFYLPRIIPVIGIAKVPSPLVLPAGPGPVIYNYTVWNVGGKQALTGVTVKDDKCEPVVLVSGDTNANNKLDPGENWKYSCQVILLDTITNTAVATGYSDDSYHQIAFAKAIATVVVGVPLSPPLVNLVRVPDVLTPLPFGGGNVTYTDTITNPGVVALHDVALTDGKCVTTSHASGDTNGNSMLDPGESWVYTCLTNISISNRSIAMAEGRANGLIALGYAFNDVLVLAPGFPTTGSLSSIVGSGLQTGNRVVTIYRMNVRRKAGIGQGILNMRAKGSHGILIAGPIKKNGYIWWQVRYDDAVTGWTAGGGLRQSP